MSATPVIITPLSIPEPVDELAQQVKSAFQHKTVNSDLLKKMGQQLWICSGLTTNISHIPSFIIQQPQNLPWECLYHPTGYFIAQKIPIIRQIALMTAQQQAIQSPLKILHFATQSAHLYKNHLNFSEEKYFIYQALWPQIQAQQVLLHSSPSGYFSQFKTLLNQSWDIIILSGHSISQNNQQHLIFDSKTDSYQTISYEKIISAFQKTSVKCVILAVCESADLALKLHQSGIFVVIGMQYPILDRAASRFIQQFCQAIMHGQTVIDAVQTTRLVMHNLLKPNEQWQENETGQWMIPSLYTQSNEQPLLLNSPIQSKISTQDVKLLIGRHQAFYKLEKIMRTHKKIWLYGVGGIGKTTLAQALQQHCIAQHQPIFYVEIETDEQLESLSTDLPILAVSRQPPPNQDWTGFQLAAPSEIEFIHYAQHQGLTYPKLQCRLIYKMLQGNYQGLDLLKALPFSTQATVLRQQLQTVQRYLKAYQRK
ncbi:CHAT domain-containing protein [Candidatus Albibeggiatoa sp. nov. BB20]|uniref:CHAT domain-containing protein n=1 Tax=Candidatus Albibeggiatoa sp. nov. BB20 TaxID=3162723 RepID=UPI0033656810